MNTPTYKEQFDKLTRAYIAGKVNPFQCCGCFIGNLLNGHGSWNKVKPNLMVQDWTDGLRQVTPVEYVNALECIKVNSGGLYTADDIIKLERKFMDMIGNYRGLEKWVNPTPEMEDVLFKAFEKALSMLKQIHQSKGEIIDETPVFQKRQLQPA